MQLTKSITTADPGFGSFGVAIVAVRDRIAKFQATRETIRELSRMSNHELNDIGVTRGDIVRIARQG